MRVLALVSIFLLTPFTAFAAEDDTFRAQVIEIVSEEVQNASRTRP